MNRLPHLNSPCSWAIYSGSRTNSRSQRDTGNAELAALYLHETQEQLRKIQTEAPEYGNIPVALLIDRLAHPAHAPMQEAESAKDAKHMRDGVQTIVNACNACHTATQHAFIRITPGTEVNPFNQFFTP